MPPKLETIVCVGCGLAKNRVKEYTSKGVRKKQCKACALAKEEQRPTAAQFIQCSLCGSQKDRDADYTPHQLRTEKKCKACTATAAKASGETRTILDKICQQCGAARPQLDFARDEWETRTPKCKECIGENVAKEKHDDFSLGPRDKICEHCGAALYGAEASRFCCADGKHKVDDSKYFKAPGKALLNLFQLSWPWRDDKGKQQSNARTGKPILTGFSNESRRLNNLFCLAVHEVQSSDTTREVKLHSPATPANVRIHGTMYRRVLSTADKNPLRYLVVDPEERRLAATGQRLDKDLVARLEPMVCNKNPLMQQVTRLRPHVGKPKSDVVALALNWDEGTEEVAALLDYDSSRPVAPRAAVFRTSPASKPQYLDP
jgi:hypothetical protein